MDTRNRPAVALAILLFLVAAADHMASAQSVCNVPISGLMNCRAAATPPNPPPPSSECCSTISHADLQCLCRYKNSNILPSVGIDPNLAMQLPGKCRVPFPRSC